MFVSTNGSGPSMDRSTCVSAARLTTASGRCSANTRAMAAASAMSARTNVDARIVERPLEVQQAAGVGQLVDDDEAVGGVREGVVDEIGADEPGAAGDEERSTSMRRCTASAV